MPPFSDADIEGLSWRCRHSMAKSQTTGNKGECCYVTVCCSVDFAHMQCAGVLYFNLMSYIVVIIAECNGVGNNMPAMSYPDPSPTRTACSRCSGARLLRGIYR